MTLEDQMKQAEEYETTEQGKVLIRANVLIMNIAFRDKNYKTAALASKDVIDVYADNSRAKFILFWSNRILEIIDNRNTLAQ